MMTKPERGETEAYFITSDNSFFSDINGNPASLKPAGFVPEPATFDSLR